MPIISDVDQQFLRDHFAKTLTGDVTIIHFTQHQSKLILPGPECTFCKETRELLEELAHLSDKIHLELHDFVKEAELAGQLGVDKIPGTVLQGVNKGAVRYFGVPSGYEFAGLIEDIVDLSRGTVDLSQETRAALSALEEDVHLQVFVTPTCPYCPTVARLAHKMAMESARVQADVVEITEFPYLSQRFNVSGVPKTIINGKAEIPGALPEARFLQRILQAVQPRQADTTPGAR